MPTTAIVPVPARGLTAEEAARRLAWQGPNAIARNPQQPVWRLLARQFNSPVIWLLSGACVLAALLGEIADAAAIVTIVGLNGAIGFLQERRAERAIEALRSLTAPHAQVRRDGRTVVIPASEIVTGDVIVLVAGDVVPADARLLETFALSTNEASLTGESAPVEKVAGLTRPGAALAERADFVLMEPMLGGLAAGHHRTDGCAGWVPRPRRALD